MNCQDFPCFSRGFWRLICSAFVTVCCLSGIVSSSFGQTGHSDEALVQDADRQMPMSELEDLLTLADTLVDYRKSIPERDGAALKLEEFGHKYAIPALLVIIRDTNEDSYIRAHSVGSLSWIADVRVIDILIETLSDEDTRVANFAWEKLARVTGQTFDFTPWTESALRHEQAMKWRSWWNENRGTAKLKWYAAHYQN